MARGIKKLDELAEMLERCGGDPERLAALRQAQQFKRSWIDLAKILVEIRREGSFERWGFADFHAYCQDELQLKRATVDKLTLSYSTIHRHAPHVLTRDGVAKTIPSYEAVDYFSRALDDDEVEGRSRPRDGAVLRELKEAVFDEGKAVADLRRKFDPVLWPKAEADPDVDLLRKVSGAARRLAELISEVSELPARKVAEIERMLGALRQDVEELLTEKTTAARKGKRRAPPRPELTRD